MRVSGQRGRRIIHEWEELEFHAWADLVWMRASELWGDHKSFKKKGAALAIFQEAMASAVIETMEGPCGACGSKEMKRVGREIKCGGCGGLRL